MKPNRFTLLLSLLAWFAVAVQSAQAYYNPTTGRWLNRDPLEEQGGVNLHASVANNPVTAVDAFGTDPDWPTGGDIAETYASSGVSLAASVRDAVENFNTMQLFTSDVMDSAQGETDDLYVNLLTAGNLSFSADLYEAVGSTRSAEEARVNLHHVMPQAMEFQRMFEQAKINVHDFTIRINARLHSDLHESDWRRGRGGMWNADWRDFMNSSIPKTQETIVDFATSMLERYGLVGKDYVNYYTGK